MLYYNNKNFIDKKKQDISTFFYLSGKGLSKEYVENSTIFLKKLVELWVLSTPTLIQLYYQIKEKKIVSGKF